MTVIEITNYESIPRNYYVKSTGSYKNLKKKIFIRCFVNGNPVFLIETFQCHAIRKDQSVHLAKFNTKRKKNFLFWKVLKTSFFGFF